MSDEEVLLSQINELYSGILGELITVKQLREAIEKIRKEWILDKDEFALCKLEKELGLSKDLQKKYGA
jgi:hypothetical protein